MLFNSVTFVIFFGVVLAGYFLLKNDLRKQNLFLLISSYIFYGYWDWRFTFLLAFSTAVDFIVSLQMEKTEAQLNRKRLLLISILVNLGALGFFKYFNFFAENFTLLFQSLGMNLDPITLHIILPVGISFYTFQSMAYTIDVYRRKMDPVRDPVDFALYVSFFSQLVAGPIERALHLLPQIQRKRQISYHKLQEGLYLVLWGYFKKVVIADNVAMIADRIFNNYGDYHGLDIWIGVLAFTVQIYCDFSGYTDIARGTSKFLGFDLMLNFKLPYFAQDPSDFWSRWHISLSSWLRDYLYIPLGGNRKGDVRTLCNLMITMLLGGLWHGAAWNFVLWGFYHGCLLVIYRMMAKRSSFFKTTEVHHLAWSLYFKIPLMFCFTVLGWLIFRVRSMTQFIYMITHSGFQVSTETSFLAGQLLFFSVPLIVMQIIQYSTGNLEVLLHLKERYRTPVYALLILGMILYGVRRSMQFIYFQF